MSANNRIFRFEQATFTHANAHDGVGNIAYARVLSGTAINWIDLVSVPPGTSIGPHRHGQDDEEVYIIVSGQGRMTVEHEEIEVGPGDVIHNPPAGRHGLRNLSDTALRVVVVGVPVHGKEPPS